MRCKKNIFAVLGCVLALALCLPTTALAQTQTINSQLNDELSQDEQAGTEGEAFTAEEAAYIRRAPVLRVGYLSDWSPIEFYDEETDSAEGISIDIMRKISENSGLRFEFVPTESPEQALEMIHRGEIQLVTGLIQSDQFTELYQLEPTAALIDCTLVFIIKQGTEFSEVNPVLAIPKGWPTLRQYMERSYPEVKIVEYPDSHACLIAVQNGQAKLAVLHTLNAERLLRESNFRTLTANNMRKGSISLCLGTATDADPALRTVLNKSIAAIDKNTRNQITYLHTISNPYSPSFAELFRYNLPLFLFGTLLFSLALFALSMRSRRKLNALAFYDPLTGEMNLNKFMLETQKLMNRRDKSYAVLAVDIDKFKAINALFGYEYGDQILKLFAKALRASLLPGTILCRGAGDKFYMFFNYYDPLWMDEKFNWLVKNVDNAIARNMPSCHIALSCGVCVILPDDKNIASIIDRADIASRHVKSYHESSYSFYDKSMYDQINLTRSIESSMSLALQNEEFVIYLQPKIELATNQIAGAEALVRWLSPVLTMPNEFIPLFEENGFIVNLDFYVLKHVCILLERWKKEGRKLFTISVNLSRRHLFHADTAQRLRDLVAEYDVDPSLIEVELTESAFDNCDIPSINALFDQLHGFGFTVSVDDFGAGYSSLSLLKDLPIDVLKIDRSFFDCQQTCETGKMVILLESVISLSRKLNIKTVSEGVETEQQINLLLQLGCDLVQGFYFAAPMPISELEALLDTDAPFGAVKG